MLVDEVARPQEISLAAFRNSPEIHGRAPLLSFLRAAYASDEGSRHLHAERAVARTTLYSSGAREAEAGAGTSSNWLNGLAYQTARGLLHP